MGERAETIGQYLRNLSDCERDNKRLEILCQLDENGCGRERYYSDYYDDPDNEDSSLANVRLELLDSVNQSRQQISNISKKLINLETSEKRPRRILKHLVHL